MTLEKNRKLSLTSTTVVSLSLNRFNLFIVVMAESFIQNFLFPVDKQKVLHLSDPLINVIGTWGVWQISSFLYLSLMVAWDASHMFNMKFTTYTVDYWCEKPIKYRHLSNEAWLNISTPLNLDSTKVSLKISKKHNSFGA